MSEVLAQLEKKGGGDVIPFGAQFVARYNGGQCYGGLMFDATQMSKISFSVSVNNARVPDGDGLRYIRVLNQNNQQVLSITGTGAKEITVDPSWGQSKLNVYTTATADYGSITLSNIIMK